MTSVRWLILSIAVVVSGASAVGLACGGGEEAAAPQDQRVHICPMRCVKQGETQPYTQAGPGPCPVCGMALVPRD